MATIKKVKRDKGPAYLIGYMHPDKKKWTKRVVYCSYADALKIKAGIETDYAFDKFNLSNPKQRKYLWSQLLDRYKKYSKRNKSQKTIDREEFVFKAFKIFLEGDVYINEITAETIGNYKQKRLGKDKTAATVSIELRVLRAVFNKAVEWKYITKNPANGVKLPKSEDITVRFLTRNEVERLIKAIKDDNNIPFLRLVLAYLHTGARRNELLDPQFTWDDVNFDEKKIMINGVKGENNRYIPMNKVLFDILNEIKKEGSAVPFSDKPYFVSHKIAEYYKTAKITGANLHSLRKTFGSWLIQEGKTDLYVVSRLLGHKSLKTTERYYVDLISANYKQAVESLEGLM